MRKKKVIIYGLGMGYTRIKDYIENKCDVIGYSVGNCDRQKILGGAEQIYFTR